MTVGALEILLFLFVVFLILSPTASPAWDALWAAASEISSLSSTATKRTRSSPEENATKSPRGSAD
jgi:hypothetical protein